MRRILLISALLAATNAGAQAGPPAVSGGCAVVPFLPGASVTPVVEVMLGGKGPYRFAIDTGAAGHGRIKPELAQELGFAVVGEARAPAPGGAVATRKIFGVPEMKVGGVTFADVGLVEQSGVRGPGVEWDGILGIGLFQQLALTLDYANRRVMFGGAGLKAGLPLAFDRAIPLVTLGIGDKSFAVHLDTGNGVGALFLDEPAAKMLPLAGPPVERGKARTTFSEFSIMEAPLAVPVTAGSMTMPIKAVGWPGAMPGGNLGSKGLAGMTLTIDTAARLLDIRASGAAPVCPA